MKPGKVVIPLFIFIVFHIHSLGQVPENMDPIPDLTAFCSEQKGFNLLGKFDVSWSNTGFSEKEFSIINELGFNFVRLPLDYRTYTIAGNWDNFIESEIKKIDAAVEWGKKYNIHVCINLHRAPGYCVNKTTLPANQQLDLWKDSVAQKAFVKHWEFFASRYKNSSPSRLSFNLVNEPSNVSETDYLKVMTKAINAIHTISPNRLVFVDGLDYARKIMTPLKNLPNVAQAIHSYDPFSLTHYKASWVEGSGDWPVPQWPMLSVSNYLYGTWKSEFKTPLILKGNFPAGTVVTVNVRQVSIESALKIWTNNKAVYTKNFVCSASLGADFTKIVETQWGFQNISNKDFSVTLAEASNELKFENSAGDWMTINSISIKTGSKTFIFTLSDNTWGSKQKTYMVDENGTLKTTDGQNLLPFEMYELAIKTAKENNIPIMVQEFGVHNQTPHKVAVDFLSDLSAFFRDHKMGWALWNLTGSFGILNSSRTDCEYELYQGYKLDREMLNALTKSGTTAVSNGFQKHSFNLFPNPARNEIYFSFPNLSGEVTVEIRDISGKLIRTLESDFHPDEVIRLDISFLNPGLHSISLFNKSTKFSCKFLVQ